ncbi:MAG: Omp28 family outer membrane lipoprotein [Bacteroidales bacterium]|nr:Omp28 family outer membrane lipoprotein [Bacteroidales bacterium]
MKTANKILFFVIFGLLIQACDKIDMPYKQTGNNQGGTETKKVLLEDYTGHTCPNCPTASRLAISLQGLYAGKLIVMSVHAGFFAEPMSVVPFKDDFRSAAGSVWNDQFGISGYPKGMINRMEKGGSTILDHGTWASTVSEMIDEPAVATIKITTTYDISTRKLDIGLTSKLLSDTTGMYKVQVCIIEDSIVGGQKDGSKIIKDYMHRHVLREAINTPSGSDLVSGGGPDQINTEYTHDFSLNLNSAYDDSHITVVAWIFKADDNSIIQVEEKKIR